MTEGEFGGLWTFIALLAFLSVCVWAYSSRRRADFEEAANLPFAHQPATKDAQGATTHSEQEQSKS